VPTIDPQGRRLSPARLLARGLTKRCPRCGAGHLFRHWFAMTERCPGCGYRFAREDGFFLGAYVINFAVTEALIGVLLFAYIIAMANSDKGIPLLPVIAVALGAAIAAPTAFFPFSRTIWAAIDLIMRPLEADEIVEADAYASHDRGSAGAASAD
jgi:uncharacterized protein (DUF983 family)